MRRSLVYEIWCIKCQMKEERKMEEETEDEEEERERGIQLHKYVGETNRCVNERALKHWMALQTLSSSSHMSNHVIENLEEEELEQERFRIKVL